ncbi:hypothetical protein DY138_03225 [Apilactobacillus timberlakei]|uniref:hypothetical protein n=1 Tax=Apilactobacillus timberlakei TaxID=2008380 RepID=UPI00112C4037|nr:hypothetical protein [Apilactobacillus timberlakei]TPR19672.1 hypothetical protein DY138_03225 [Apilactobacillus timberlakei]TPR20649.1 hypothetical protein DY061_04865 [Apilactobacillus timberlakei]TPR22692.1 hypothetical protein DY083_04135 [Apilactobacillus timberlakei]
MKLRDFITRNNDVFHRNYDNYERGKDSQLSKNKILDDLIQKEMKKQKLISINHKVDIDYNKYSTDMKVYEYIRWQTQENHFSLADDIFQTFFNQNNQYENAKDKISEYLIIAPFIKVLENLYNLNVINVDNNSHHVVAKNINCHAYQPMLMQNGPDYTIEYKNDWSAIFQSINDKYLK